MKRLTRIATYLAVTVAATHLAATQETAQDRIQAIYDQIGKAFEKRDVDGVARYSLPDATVRLGGGPELTLDQWKERARKGWANIKKTKSRFTVEETSGDGSAVIATYTESHEMVSLDPNDKQEHDYMYRGRWRATLKMTSEGWRLSRSEELERRVTRDGTLIDQWPKDPSDQRAP